MGGNGALTNNGTVIKSAGAGTSSIIVQTTTNSGLFDIQSGTLEFVTNVPHTGGEVRLTSGDLLLSAGTHTFDATSSITDPGLDNNLTVQTAGTTLTMNGAYTVGGTTTVTSATANFNVDADFPVLTNTGTVNLNLAGNTYTASTVTLTFGAINVTDATSSLDIDTGLVWDGGSLGGAGTVNLLNTGTSQLTGVNTKRLIPGTTLVNDGILQIQSTDNLDLDGTLTNNNLIDFQSNAGFGGSGTFTNALGATTQKSAGGGTSTISTTTITNNAGTFHVQSDTLAVDNLTDSAGTITVDAGTIFRTSGDLTSTGLIEGEGTVDVGTLFNQGNLNPGTSPGIITIDGDADFTGGILNFEVNGLTPGTEHDQIIVTGSVTLGGTINVTAGFAPSEGDTFDLITCGGTGCGGAFGTENLPANFGLSNLGAIVQLDFSTCAGSICWDNESGDGFWTTLLNWDTDILPVAGDDVVIDLGGGTLVTLNSGAQSITSLTAVEDITISGGGTSLTVSGSANFSGTLTASAFSTVNLDGDASFATLTMFTGPAVNLNLAGDTYTANTVNLLGGTLSVTDATSSLNIDTAFDWDNSVLGGSGTTTLLAGTSAQLSSSGFKALDTNATLVNNTTLDFASVNSLTLSGTLINNATIDLQGDIGMSGIGTLTNTATGTIQKSAGVGTSLLSVTNTTNSGLLDVQTGVLQINNLGTSSGTVDTATGTIFRPNGNFTNTGTIQGEGTVDVVTLTNQGTINPGTSPGILTIDGDADFTGGILNFEVNGLTPGTEHDQIIVTGSVTLGGTINVITGFAPAENDTFDLVTCGGTGCGSAFVTENLPADFSLANLGAIVQLSFATCAGTICWDDDGGDGLWLTAINWTTDLLPGALDDVVIDFGGGNTVTLSSGIQTINSLINEDSLIIFGGAELRLTSTSNSNGDLALGGTLGGAGDLTVNGLFDWGSGGDTFVNISGGLITTATTNLNSTGDKRVDTTWTNQGIVNWNDGDIHMAGGTFNNDATFNILTADGNDVIEGGGGVFNNNATGTVNKTLGGTIRFINNGSFTNTGLFDLDAGTLRLEQATTTTATGVYNIADGATLNFFASTHNVANPNAFVADTTNAQLLITNSTVNLNASTSLDADIDLTLSSATLSGSADLTVNGLFDWGSGGDTFVNISGGLITTATTNLNSTGDKRVDTTWTNQGIVNWNDGDIHINGGTFNNDATFNILTDDIGDLIEGAGGVFNNNAAGIVNKTSTVTTRFTNTGGKTNSGLVNISAGTLEITSTYTQSAGETRLSGGNLTTTFALNGGSLTGNGTVTGNVTSTGGTIAPGLSPDILVITGDLILDSTSVVNIELEGTTPGPNPGGHDQIQVTGTASLDGTLNVTLPGAFTPGAADTFTIITCGVSCLGGVTMQFTTENSPAGQIMTVNYNANDVVLDNFLAGLFWDNQTGNDLWTDPLNWSTDTLPGVADNVLINIVEGESVFINTGIQSINSLVSDEDIIINGGTLTIANSSQLNGGLTIGPGGTSVLNGTGDVTVAGLTSWTGNGSTIGGSGTLFANAGVDIDFAGGPPTWTARCR